MALLLKVAGRYQWPPAVAGGALMRDALDVVADVTRHVMGYVPVRSQSYPAERAPQAAK